MSSSEISAKREKRGRSRKSSYWEHLVSQYEKRNASLERRQAALTERVRFMECTLPSLMMGAVVNMKRGPDLARAKTSSRSGSQCSGDRCPLSSFCHKKGSSDPEETTAFNAQTEANLLWQKEKVEP